MDFTIKKYKELLETFINSGYSFQTLSEFVSLPLEKVIILRHDVDKLPENSLQFAIIQHNVGVKGSYYFRTIPASYNEDIIVKIAGLGHEVGYHYETMDTCGGIIENAYVEFCKNLEMMRAVTEINTICMHGSPLSSFDNRAIWHKYDYHNLNIVAEPYFELDFNKVFYLTDTGRRFDGSKMSIRDKPMDIINIGWPVFHSTIDIIHALNEKRFPDLAMINFHPQRWTSDPLLWTKEFVWQNLKNIVKKRMVKNQILHNSQKQ
jgi:hypothetical protein